MSTAKYFYDPTMDVVYKDKYSALNDEERSIIRRNVDIMSHIMLLDNLYQILRFNLMNIFTYYDISLEGDLTLNPEFNLDTTDEVAINALFISFISAGKTFVESINVFLEKYCSSIYEKIRENYICKEYDDNFCYRLLLRVRDFSQHGHLPLLRNNGNQFSIDVNHILYSPNFSHNKATENELSELRLEYVERFGDYPYVKLNYSLFEFKTCLTRIFLGFLKEIRETVHKTANESKGIINKHEGGIVVSPKKLEGFFPFEKDSNGIEHFCDSKANAKKQLSELKNYVASTLKYDEEILLNKTRFSITAFPPEHYDLLKSYIEQNPDQQINVLVDNNEDNINKFEAAFGRSSDNEDDETSTTKETTS